MPAVTHICTFLFLLAIISACSDNGTDSTLNINNRLTHLNTPFVTEEGGDGDKKQLLITYTPTVTGVISYSTFNVTAAEISDYTPISGERLVVEGEQTEFLITIIGDKQIEGDELIGLSIKLDGEEISVFYGGIINDDFPTLSVTSPSVLEGDTGTALLRFTFELDEEVVDPYVFYISTPTVDDSENNLKDNKFYAIPDVDFKRISEKIEFTKGGKSIIVDVEVYSDYVIEMDELVKVQAQLFDEQGGVVVTGSGKIQTDDMIGQDRFNLVTSSISQKEGSSEDPNNLTWTEVKYRITVERPGNIIETQAVQIKLEGSDDFPDEQGWATLGLDGDYCANDPRIAGESGEFQCHSVNSYTLEPNTEYIDASFYVLDDLVIESSIENIKVTIQNDQGITFGEVIHSIEEDDVPELIVTYTANGDVNKGIDFKALMSSGINVSEAPSEEGGSNILELSIQLKYPLNDVYAKLYEFSHDDVIGNDIDANDYTFPSELNTTKTGNLSFLAGSNDSNILNVSINNDDDYEGNGILYLEVEDFGRIPITIIDDDLPNIIMKDGSGSVINDEVIALHEQDSSGVNDASQNKKYAYSLELEEGVSALSDMYFQYSIADIPAETLECGYLMNSESKREAIYYNPKDPKDDFDYKIYINDELISQSDPVILAKDYSSLNLIIEVNNDVLVECEEYFSLELTLKPEIDSKIEDGNTLVRNFSISNKDKALLTVKGWRTSEGSTDILENPPTTNKNYTLALSQPLVTSINYSLTGEGLSCHNSDASGHTNDQGLSFNVTGASKNIPVIIAQDNVVEPDESCKLEIKSFEGDLVELQYFNEAENGAFSSTADGFATGLIKNDDGSVITFDLSESTCDADAEVFEDCNVKYEINTSHDIAANVEEISIDFQFSGDAVNDSSSDYTFFKTGQADELINSSSNRLILKGTDNALSHLSATEFTQAIREDTKLEVEEAYGITVALVDAVNLAEKSIVMSPTVNSITGIIPENGGTLQITLRFNPTLQEGTEVSLPLTVPQSVQYPFTIETNVEIGSEVESIFLNVSKLVCAEDELYCTDDNDLEITSQDFPVHSQGTESPIKGAGDLRYTKFKVVQDPTLEKDEALELQFTLSGGSSIPQRLYINDSAVHTETGLASLKLENDDSLNVKITKTSSGDSTLEKDLSEVFNTVQYAMDLSTSIANNYPALSLITTDPSAVTDGIINYAKVSDADYSLSSLSIHDGSNFTVSGSKTLTLTVTPDDRLETNELIAASFSLTDTSDFISLDTIDGLSKFNYTINNDDELVIDIKKNTADMSQDEGDLDVDSKVTESNVTYTASLSSVVAPNFPDIRLISNAGQGTGNARSGKDNDYLLTLPEIHTLNAGITDTPISNLDIDLTIYGESSLEPTELVEEQLEVITQGTGVSIKNSGHIISNTASGGKIAYTINNDDQLNISITKDDSGNSTIEGDLDGNAVTNKAVPYTISLSNPIGSNYPTIALTSNVTVGSEFAKETADFTLDFNTLHTQNINNNTADTAAADAAMILNIKGENTLEPAETVELELDHNVTDAASLNLSGPVNIVLVNDNAVISTTAAAVKTAGTKISHQIINNDNLNITITAPEVLEGNEGNDTNNTTDIIYAVTLSNKIAANYPSISLASTLVGGNSAILNTDYTLDHPSIHTRNLASDADDTAAADNLEYVIKIKGETMLERDEDIALSVAETSPSDDILVNGSNSDFSLAYKIINDDTLTVSVTPDTGINTNEGDDTGAADPEYQTITYTVDTDIVIAKDYPAFDLTFTGACTQGCATAASDFTFNTDAVAIHDGSEDTASDATFTQKALYIVKDTVVERTEEVGYTLGFSETLDDFVKIKFNNAVSNALTHTIRNDDFIQITLTDNTASLTEETVSTVAVTVGAYTSSGLAATQILQSLTSADFNLVTGSESFDSDSDVEGIAGFSHSIVSSLASSTSPVDIFNVKNDTAIEPSESFTVGINLSEHSDYVRVQGSATSASADIEYTIEDDDKLYVELEKFHYEDNGVTDGSYPLKLCYATNPIIQGPKGTNTDVELALTLSGFTASGVDILKINGVDNNDLSSITESLSFNLASAFTLDVNGSQYCQQAELFKTKYDTTIEGTEWLNIDFSWGGTADSRIIDDNFGSTDIVIIDNDFPYMTQTGVSKCIDNGDNSDNSANLSTDITTCYGTTNVDHKPIQDFTSAEVVNGVYPEQHFTVITNGKNESGSLYTGEPSITIPAVGGTDFDGDNGYCLLDSYSNNVWLIGGFDFDFDINTHVALNSTQRVPFYDINTAVKTALSIQTQSQSSLTWCGLASDANYQWRLPTAQELLTILNVEKLRGATELSGDPDVVLGSYFQHHLNDSDTNAAQAHCELTAPTTCMDETLASTLSSYYWTGETCVEDAAIAASSAAITAREYAGTKISAAETAQAELKADPSNAALTAAAADANEEAETAVTQAEVYEINANGEIAAQTHAWVVDFATGMLSCRLKTDTAHVRLVYKSI